MAETSGQVLQRELGLEKFRHARIARALLSSQNILFIWYNSRSPQMPVTTHMIKSWPYVASIMRGTDAYHGKAKTSPFGPIVDLKDYNGNLLGAIVIPVDISGRMYINSRNFTKQIEDFVGSLGKFELKEGVTIPDLKNNATSNRNSYFYKIRFNQGNPGSHIKTVTWNKKKDTLLITFRTNPTWGGTNPIFTAKGHLKKSNFYTLKVQFERVSNWLGDRDTFMEFGKGEQIELVRSMLTEAETRLYSSDMSFYWQGSWEYLSQIDATVYPFWGTKGKGIWAARHGLGGLHITKHFVEIFMVIFFLAPDIAKMIREKYS